MAVYNADNKESYKGAVLYTDEHMWMDGMLEEWAVVWDIDTHDTKKVQIGYYGSDGCNLAGGRADVDVDMNTALDMYHTFKEKAYKAFASSVTEYKQEIRKGRKTVVIRGKKVAKGTELEVFWVGEKETYMSRQNPWLHETELIAGCYDKDGNKVWIKAEYLKAVDPIKSPVAKERKKFINDYVENELKRHHVSLEKMHKFCQKNK